VARELRPKWLLLENVPGLLSSAGGRDFTVVLAALGDIGYGVAWRVLDARFFGVPQRRRRVFLVGRLGAPCPPEVLFEPEGVLRHPAAGGEAGAVVAYPIAAGAGGSKFGSGRDSQDTFVTAFSLHADALGRTGEAQTPSPDAEGRVRLRDPGLGVVEGESYTLAATAPHAVAFNHIQDPVSSPSVGATLGEEGQAVAYTVHSAHSNAALGNGDTAMAFPSTVTRSLDTFGGYAPNGGGTVVAGTLNGAALDDDAAPLVGGDGPHGRSTHNGLDTFVTGAAVRRLTPTECARLQGFPDDWNCLCGVQPYSTWACVCPDGPRYASYGNAVCVPVVEWLGRRLLAVHEGECRDG
jgi:DNA (cytosine-5)-methyltransferase 1